MGIISKIKEKLGKKKEEPLEELQIPEEVPKLEPATLENMKAKMDLILTQMESLRIQNETLNERLKIIEKLLVEIKKLATS